MNIIGLDIGKSGLATVCRVCDFPENVTRYFNDLRRESCFLKLTPCASNLDIFLDLQPDVVILEPTGGHYSNFWHQVCKVYQIPIYWMSHQELKGQRNHFGFTNKRDEEDAYTLAISFLDPQFIDRFGRKRFIPHYHHEKVAAIRELFYELEQLDKLRTMLVQQTRQRLSFEYPEAATRQYQRTDKGTVFFKWLGQQYPTYKKRAQWDASVARRLGIDIADYTIAHSQMITDVENRIISTEGHLERLTTNDEFIPYLKAFAPFGFGLTLTTLMLLTCYPFEKFLVEGRPLVEYELSRNGKPSARYRSLRSFQAFLGLERRIEQSGDRDVKKFAGSTMIRSHLYAWFQCRIAPSTGKLRIGNYRLKTETGQVLGEKYDKLRQTVKGKDAAIRCLYLMSRKLFYSLCDHLIEF